MINIVTLKKGKDKKILSGHPWVYDNEIDRIPDNVSDGDIVFVANNSFKKIGAGYFNRKSKISIRILDFIKNDNIRDFDIEDLLKKRIKVAIGKRENIKNTDAKRLIFSEADFLPGLIVDKFKNLIVIQITTSGMEKQKKNIIKIIDELINPDFIYEKSISEVRLKEGLKKEEKLLKPENGKIPEIIINENGIKFLVSVDKGSKTGFYLDQRENREKLINYVKEKSVLDCFCYTGGFSAYALRYGAKSAIGIDISEKAVSYARKNMEFNNLKNYEFIKSDVFEMLEKLKKNGRRFDMIILDPPPFSKTEKEKKDAIKGYEFLHRSSFEILNNDGILFSFSCSQNISREDLLGIIKRSAAKSRALIEIIDFLKQSSDHPWTDIIPETFYLKGFIIKKL